MTLCCPGCTPAIPRVPPLRSSEVSCQVAELLANQCIGGGGGGEGGNGGGDGGVCGGGGDSGGEGGCWGGGVSGGGPWGGEVGGELGGMSPRSAFICATSARSCADSGRSAFICATSARSCADSGVSMLQLEYSDPDRHSIVHSRPLPTPSTMVSLPWDVMWMSAHADVTASASAIA